MAVRARSGYLANARASTGRDSADLPEIPSEIIVFITISGTATVQVEVADDPLSTPIAVAQVTATSIVVLGIPASKISTNVSVLGGGSTVTATFRSYVGGEPPQNPVSVFTAGALIPPAFSVSGVVTSTLTGNQKRLYGPAQPGVTAATVYTVPAGKTSSLQYLHASNDTALQANLTISVGADAAATRILDAFPLPPHGLLSLPMVITLTAAEIIQVLQGTASAITVILNGTEA